MNPHCSNQGYSAQLPYIYAYFRQQHPAMMHWQLLLQGYQIPSEIQHLPHLELGFGQGLGLSLTAVSRQGESYIGVDFMPEHCAGVAQLCEGITPQLVLHSTDFQTFLANNTQQFQSISLHGVWSWVNPEVRQQLVSIFDQCLARGGIVYLSHNTLPGRAPVLPLQRLLYLTGQAPSEDALTSLSTAFSTLAEALPLSRYAQAQPSLVNWWDEVSQSHPTYLMHEYMSSAWFPMLFADTAQTLAQAGLDYVCSADVMESIKALHLTQAQQAWLARFDDQPLLQESYSDLLRDTAFRRDIWAKDIQRYTPAARLSAILSTQLALIQPVDALPLTLTGDLGEFELPQAIYRPVLSWIEQQGIITGNDLHAHLNHTAHLAVSEVQCVEIVQNLSAIGYLHPAQSSKDIQAATSHCHQLNQRLCQQAWTSSAIHYLASPVTGCGIQVSPWQQLCLLARQVTQSDQVHAWLDYLTHQPEFAHRFAQDTDLIALTQAAQAFAQIRLPLLLRLLVTA